jgi:hypothetical protein
VPAVMARASGIIEAGRSRWPVVNAVAYHDHNWGYWRAVHWDWGQVQSPDQDISLVYGAIHAPELDAAGAGGRYFLILTGREGFLGLLRPREIVYEDWSAGPTVRGRNTRVPGRIRLAAATGEDRIELVFTLTGAAASLPEGVDGGTADPRSGPDRAFLQMRGVYEVTGRVGGRNVAFRAPGAAETFVPLPTAR